jgi:hypothetical protein
MLGAVLVVSNDVQKVEIFSREQTSRYHILDLYSGDTWLTSILDH